jgi:2-polyprenyl-3-methyl-5-hydroxy-6-metoxy-1,4-benzoquinol methylase
MTERRRHPVDLDSAAAHGEGVRSQWRALERLERLPEADARRLHAAEYMAQDSDAVAHVPKLKKWPSLPDRSHRVYTGKSNMCRIWRLCQFLSPDDRILDIGMGHGWTAGVLAHVVRPAAYSGVDLTDDKFASVREMADVNGLDGSSWYLGIKDLYDLTRDWVDQRKPTIVLLLEVLEHVPDSQRALTTIANAIGSDTELLFSVPMLGRIESCWGHVSIFDGQRVRQLCENAGLYVHWVEPLYNTWQFVLVSRSPEPPARLVWLPPSPLSGADVVDSDIAAGTARATLSAATGDPYFHRVSLKPVSLEPSAWATPRSHFQVHPHDTGGVRVVARARRGLFGRQQYAGIAFPVDGLRVLRLEMSLPKPGGVSRLLVEGRDDGGRRTVLWELKRGLTSSLPTKTTTYVLRPGHDSGGFRPVDQTDPGATRVVELVAHVGRRSVTSLVLRRAAYVR